MNDRYGELAIDGEQAVISFVRHLPYPMETVWSAIADPGQHEGSRPSSRTAWAGTSWRATERELCSRSAIAV